MKKVFLSSVFILICNTILAQVGSEFIGQSLTPQNNDPIPYDGITVLGSPGALISSGDYNTVLGDGAGSSLTTGDQNIFIGAGVGTTVDSDTDLTFIGAFAADQTGTNNFDSVVIGTRAARTLNGGDNVVIGTEAGMAMLGANDNVIIGEEAGQSLTDGDDNVIIGEDAGFDLTTGSDNCFIGPDAGRMTTTAGSLTFVGGSASISIHDALELVNSEYYTVALSGGPGYDNTSGTGNTFIGSSAGTDNGVGNVNTFVGYGAGANNEHGDGNTFIGYGAGYDNNRTNSTTNANRNTYIGMRTGGVNREGSDNVGLGYYADFNNTNRSRSTFVGSYAKPYNNDVTMLGYDTEVRGQYGIAIGISAELLSATGGIGIGHLVNLNNNADYSIGIGKDVAITEDHVVAIGRLANISKAQSVGLGANTIVENEGAIVIGYGANSTDLIDNTGGDPDATNNIAIGYNATTSAFNSVAIGNAASAAIDNTMVLGGATNPLSVGIGTDAPNVLASLTLEDTNKGLLLNRMTTALRTTLGSSLTAAEHGMLVYDTEDKAVYVWDGTQWLSATIDTDDQTVDVFQLNANNLELSLEADGVATQTVDLSGYLDNTDAQAISLATNTLSITGNAGTVDLSGYLDNTDAQNLSLTGSTLNISNGTGVDLSSFQDGTGTDSQELALASDVLSISGGTNTVDLSAYANTDSQNLTAATLTGSIIQIDIQNGTSVSVDISPLIADLENRVTILEACACNPLQVGDTESVIMMPVLEQNIPNPFDATSAIGYYVPHTVSQADIVFSNNVGQIVNRITITQKGEGEVSVDASNYASGMYYYTLYLDGKKIDTKKMIVD